MKAKLTVTIDEELIPKAKEQARSQGLSLSDVSSARLFPRKAPVILGALARRVQGRSPEGRSLQGAGRKVPVNV